MTWLLSHWRAFSWPVCAAVFFLLGFAVGHRHTPPVAAHQLVNTVSESHEVVRTVTKVRKVAARDVHRTTRTTTTRTPGGATTVIRETTTDSHARREADTHAQTEGTIDTKAHTVTENSTKDRATWRINALVGLSGSLSGPTLKPTYGLQVERRLLGPINGGVWFLTQGAAGISLGVEW